MLRHRTTLLAIAFLSFGLVGCDDEAEVETPEGEVEIEAEDGEVEVEED